MHVVLLDVYFPRRILNFIAICYFNKVCEARASHALFFWAKGCSEVVHAELSLCEPPFKLGWSRLHRMIGDLTVCCQTFQYSTHQFRTLLLDLNIFMKSDRCAYATPQPILGYVRDKHSFISTSCNRAHANVFRSMDVRTSLACKYKISSG